MASFKSFAVKYDYQEVNGGLVRGVLEIDAPNAGVAAARVKRDLEADPSVASYRLISAREIDHVQVWAGV